MTTAEEVIGVAHSELGYTEGRDNGTKFGQWYGIPNGQWCAMFVSWCFHKAGLPLPASTAKGFAYTPAGVEWFQDQGRWGTEPRLGAVVFYKFPKGPNRVHHCGLVTSHDGQFPITAIEGNTNAAGSRTGGSVLLKSRRSSIVGYGRPAYARSSPPPPARPPTRPTLPPNPPREFVDIPGDLMKLPLLKRGHTGHYVKILQGLLLVHAPDIVAYSSGGHQNLQATIDGQFGAETEAVLRAWQSRTTLTADGVCGSATWSWLIGAT